MKIFKILHDEFLYDECFKFLPQPYIHACYTLSHTFTFYFLRALSVVKLCRPIGVCHAVKIKILLHVHSHMLLLLRKYASTYIHSFPSPEPPKSILLLIRERMAKNISIFPCEINAQVILLLPLAILSHEKSALKKKRDTRK